MTLTFQDRRSAAVPRGIASATPLVAARALESEIWDVDGNRYIDFAAGIAVLNVGHRHPKVIEAVKSQLDSFTHTSFQVLAYESYVRLAERLNSLAPFSKPARTIFLNSGSEAVECAVKIARMATARSAVIAFTGAFHGRTLMATALTGKVSNYKRGFGSMTPEVFHLPFPNSGAHAPGETLQSLDMLFAASIDPERVAAIIIEPVQGEGGFYPAPHDLLTALREICDRHGILLIADEVQTGFARTGKMFAIEHSGVEPDIIAVAKGMGGGFPLSGVIGRADVMDAGDPGSLGSTYGGSPVSCAAGLAVLDVIAEEKLTERAAEIGERMRGRIAAFSERDDLRPISQPRGLGAMVAFDVVDACGEAGAPSKVREIMARARDRGLIILSCGSQAQAVRLLPPLTIPTGLLDEGLDILEAALSRS